MKLFAQLTKVGITIFVVLSAIAGFALGFESEKIFEWQLFFDMVMGVFLLSSGSLALNQVQEYKLDASMKRTQNRPVASGKIKPAAAGILAFFLILAGLICLYKITSLCFLLGLSTVILYNGVYTYYWKPKWIYAAIPGAIPGALPVTIGYSAINNDIFSRDSIYLFLILFLWQMPHFWALAIRFKDDYKEGGVPTLPVVFGLERTIYQMGMYTLGYVGCALASPFFYKTSWFYILLVVPISIKILWEYKKYRASKGSEGWLKFFMWVNISVLIYLYAPMLDKWNFLFFEKN